MHDVIKRLMAKQRVHRESGTQGVVTFRVLTLWFNEIVVAATELIHQLPNRPKASTDCLIMPLTQDEIDGCRDAFLAFDKDRSGTIDVWELRQVLEAMGQKPTEEELFQMISEVDDNMSGSIDFGEFLKVSFRHSHALHVYDLIYQCTFLPSSS